MKDIILFLYTYYGYYFLILAGAIAGIIGYVLTEKRLGSLKQKIIVMYIGVIYDCALAIIIRGHVNRDIFDATLSRKEELLIKCFLMVAGIALYFAIVVVIKNWIIRIVASLSEYRWGILTFVYLLSNLVTNLPQGINAWGSVWYATDYSMGIASRFFIGTLLKLFYTDYLSGTLVYNFCMINFVLIIILVSYFVQKVIGGCDNSIKPAILFLWFAFLAGPGSITNLWEPGMVGRLEAYGLLISLVCLFISEKIRNKNIAYFLITVLSCIAIAIYQGYIFMYYAIVLMIFVWEIIGKENKEIISRIWGAINVLFTSITFLIFQFFSYTIFKTPNEMVETLSKKTDLYISSEAVRYEMASSIADAYNELNIPYITGSYMPREQVLLLLILMGPIFIILLSLYIKCNQLRKIEGRNIWTTPHVYFAGLTFIILPQFMLNIDWGRWLTAANIVVYIGIAILICKGDRYIKIACQGLARSVVDHKYVCVIVLLFIAGISRYDCMEFTEQTKVISNWLLEKSWIIIR